MNRVLGALKATYNFFSGDAITLTAALVAFALAWFLAHVAHAPTAVTGIAFVAILIAGLVTTLSREVAGRSRGHS